MNTWPDTDYGAIARYTRTLPLRRAKTRRIYRNELMSFQRFIMCNGNGTVTEDSVTEWVQDRFQDLVPIVAVDHARWVHHFLDHLVQQGYLKVNPIAAIQGRYGIARLATIVRALARRRSPPGSRDAAPAAALGERTRATHERAPCLDAHHGISI
jgi:hypothetical protein